MLSWVDSHSDTKLEGRWANQKTHLFPFIDGLTIMRVGVSSLEKGGMCLP